MANRMKNKFPTGGPMGKVRQYTPRTRGEIRKKVIESIPEGSDTREPYMTGIYDDAKEYANWWYGERAAQDKYKSQLPQEALQDMRDRLSKATYDTSRYGDKISKAPNAFRTNVTGAQKDAAIRAAIMKPTLGGLASPEDNVFWTKRMNDGTISHEGIGHMAGDQNNNIMRAVPYVPTRDELAGEEYNKYSTQPNERNAQTWDFRYENRNLKDDKGNYYIDPNRQLTPEDMREMRTKGVKLPPQWKNNTDDDIIKLHNTIADIGSKDDPYGFNMAAYGGHLYGLGGLIGNFATKANSALGSSGVGKLLGGASGISGIAGGIASAASNAISGGMSTGVGGAMQTIGGIASNIPGVGGLIGAGVNVLGGLVNRAFGSQINDEFVNETKENVNKQLGAQVDDSSFESVLSQQATNRGMDAVKKSQVGKDGWFSNKAKNLTKELNKKIANANAALNMNFANAFGNVEENQNLDVMANYSAYGGPLFASGGGIHIKKANRGKFTKYCDGNVTSECIARGKRSSSPSVRKMATFAQNARGWHHSFGGWLNTHDGDFSNGITMIGNGGTHEQNPSEGVQMGLDPQGVPNLVEEGEVIFNDYVFSNRLKVPKKDRKRLRLKEGTFADAAEKLQKESSERPNDPISRRGLEASMNRLAGIQEGVRERKSGNKFADGGRKMSRAAAKRAGYDVDQKTYTDIDIPQEEATTGLAPTWMRYAPAVGSALGVFSDAIGLTNTPDYTPAEMVGKAITPPQAVGARTIGNKLTYKPLDTSFEVNRLDANTAAQRRALLDTAGGNRATAAANLIAANANYGNQMGDLHRQAELYNQQQRQQVEGFNRGTNQFNAEAQMKADSINAQQRQQFNEMRLKQRMAQAQMYDTANMRSSMGRAANLTNLFENIGGIGQENFSRNMITSNPALLYDLDSSGRVQYKKNKKKKGGRLTYGR